MNQLAAVHNFGAALRDDASGGDGGGGLRGVHHFLGQRWTTMYVKDWGEGWVNLIAIVPQGRLN